MIVIRDEGCPVSPSACEDERWPNLTVTRQPSRWMRVYAGGSVADGIGSTYDQCGLMWTSMEMLHGIKHMPCEWSAESTGDGK